MAGTAVATRARARRQLAEAHRATKKRDYKEDQLQAAIVKELRWLLKDAIVFSIPNGGYRTDSEARKLKWTGQLNGVPDLAIVAKSGRAFFIEVKAPKGVLSPAQIEMNTWFLLNCVPYCVARRIEDVRAALVQWKIDTREAGA